MMGITRVVWGVDAALAGVLDGDPDKAGGEACALEVSDDILITAAYDISFLGAGGAASLACEGLSGWARRRVLVVLVARVVWGVDAALAGVLDWHPDQAAGEACALEVGHNILVTTTHDISFLGAGRAASLACEGLSGWARSVLVVLVTGHEVWVVDTALAGVLDGDPDKAGGEACAFEVSDDILITATDDVAFLGAGGAASLTCEGLSGWARRRVLVVLVARVVWGVDAALAGVLDRHPN